MASRLFILLIIGTTATFGFPTDPVTVDQTTAVIAHEVEISQYIVDKNYNQYFAQFSANHCRPPNRTECANWFRLFFAQAVLKCRLVSDGYLGRSDIAEVVAKMSRYMLTKIDGPLYATLYGHTPVTAARVNAAQVMANCSFDVLIARFDNDIAVPKALADAGGLALFLHDHLAELNAEIHDGLIRWPFHPFEEVTDDLVQAAPGQTIGPLRRRLGVYYIMVRSSDRSQPTSPIPEEEMVHSIRLLDNDLVRRQHRAEVLSHAHFQLNRLALDRAIALQPSTSKGISETLSLPFADTVLATYDADGAPHRITAREFVQNFNRRIVRATPHTPAQLGSALEDVVLEDFDFAEARRLGLDRAPRFIEDQRNFALNQALAAYENEALLPQVVVSAADLRAYASAHALLYAAPLEARGSLIVFADSGDATRAISDLRRNGADTSPQGAKAREEWVVRRDGPPLTAEIRNAGVIAANDGAIFGPFPRAGMFAIFIKRASGARITLPFPEIEQQVRQDFVRDKVDAAEIALLREDAALAPICVRVDMRQYGLAETFLSEIEASPPHRTNFRPGPPG